MDLVLFFVVPAALGLGLGYVTASKWGKRVFWAVFAALILLIVLMYSMAADKQGWDGIGYMIAIVLILSAGAGHLTGGMFSLWRNRDRGE